MQTLTEIKSILDAHGVRPKHRFGQNFLHDHNLILKLVDAANIGPQDVVLEVGPGTGTLTEELVERSARVICCEIDRTMADILESRLGDRITLIRGDCLDSKHALSSQVLHAIGEESFKLVANLPYNVASPLMMNLLIDHPACIDICVTIQKEVADRLVAQPSTKAYGPLGIVAQTLATIRRIATVPRTCFWPQPDVTSAMVQVTPKRDGREPAESRAFARFVTTLFTKRRKQLRSIVGDDRHFPESIDSSLRPEALSVDQLRILFESIA